LACLTSRSSHIDRAQPIFLPLPLFFQTAMDYVPPRAIGGLTQERDADLLPTEKDSDVLEKGPVALDEDPEFSKLST